MDRDARAAALLGDTWRGGAVGGPAQGARRPDPAEDGGLGRDRPRRPAGQAPPTESKSRRPDARQYKIGAP